MQNLPTHPVIDSNATDEQQQMKQEQQQHLQHPKKLLQQQQVPIAVPPPPAEFVMPCTQLELGHSMGGDPLWQGRTAYPYPDPYFGSMVAAYGAQAVIKHLTMQIHPHVLGMQQAGLPLPSDTIEEPVYVNAKQYHGILRRRQSRAKAESENKLIKSRKPYLHESRHLHALKRARGCGGRFLNTKKDGSPQDGISGEKSSQDCMGQDPRADQADSVKEYISQESSDSKRIEDTGNIIKLENNDGTVHSGMIPAAASNGMYHNYHQIQPLHSSAFHLLSVGSAESGQAGAMVSKRGHHTAVATQ